MEFRKLVPEALRTKGLSPTQSIIFKVTTLAYHLHKYYI